MALSFQHLGKQKNKQKTNKKHGTHTQTHEKTQKSLNKHKKKHPQNKPQQQHPSGSHPPCRGGRGWVPVMCFSFGEWRALESGFVFGSRGVATQGRSGKLVTCETCVKVNTMQVPQNVGVNRLFVQRGDISKIGQFCVGFWASSRRCTSSGTISRRMPHLVPPLTWRRPLRAVLGKPARVTVGFAQVCVAIGSRENPSFRGRRGAPRNFMHAAGVRHEVHAWSCWGWVPRFHRCSSSTR